MRANAVGPPSAKSQTLDAEIKALLIDDLPFFVRDPTVIEQEISSSMRLQLIDDVWLMITQCYAIQLIFDHYD